MNDIKDLFKNKLKDAFKLSIIKTQETLVLRQESFNSSLVTKKFKGRTAQQTVKELFKNSKESEALKLAKEIGMSETWYLIAELNAGIEVRKFVCFNKYLTSKSPKIPCHLLAQMLFEWGNIELGSKFVAKISDEDLRQKYELRYHLV